jgi:ABC-type Na+ efflux pump permease subunit
MNYKTGIFFIVITIIVILTGLIIATVLLLIRTIKEENKPMEVDNQQIQHQENPQVIIQETLKPTTQTLVPQETQTNPQAAKIIRRRQKIQRV